MAANNSPIAVLRAEWEQIRPPIQFPRDNDMVALVERLLAALEAGPSQETPFPGEREATLNGLRQLVSEDKYNGFVGETCRRVIALIEGEGAGPSPNAIRRVLERFERTDCDDQSGGYESCCDECDGKGEAGRAETIAHKPSCVIGMLRGEAGPSPAPNYEALAEEYLTHPKIWPAGASARIRPAVEGFAVWLNYRNNGEGVGVRGESLSTP